MLRVAGLGAEAGDALVDRFTTGARDGVPEGLLSIMTDCGGNAIAMAVRPDRAGEIFFLDHEVASEEAPTLEAAESDDWGYAIVAAPSFGVFVAGLRLVRD